MLAELFEFKTKVEGVPWITEATEELIEDIVRSRMERAIEKMPYLREEIEKQAKRMEEAAKRFIRFCRKIGGKPKVREYASRYFGTIDLACYFEDGTDILSLDRYAKGKLSISTIRGYGTLELPEGFEGFDIRIKEPEDVHAVIFDETLKPSEFAVNDILGVKEISADIYPDHVKLVIHSKTYEEIIGEEE